MPGPWIPQNGHADGSSPADTRVRASCISSVNACRTLITTHPVGAAVEAAVHGGRDLVPAVEDAGVREDDDASVREGRREVPLAPALEALERPALAHRLVLRAVELVNLLLQPASIEGHARAGRNTYAFSAPMPTP